jgi:hypothetical protein
MWNPPVAIKTYLMVSRMVRNRDVSQTSDIVSHGGRWKAGSSRMSLIRLENPINAQVNNF